MWNELGMAYKPKGQVLTWEDLAFGWARHSAFIGIAILIRAAFTNGQFSSGWKEHVEETQLTNVATSV